jgi:hypothetical protein
MNDCSWMHRDSPQELYRENFYKMVEGFINFALLNPKNISEDKIRCSYVKCKKQKSFTN